MLSSLRCHKSKGDFPGPAERIALATLFVYDEAGRLLGEYTDGGALIAETIWLEDLPVAVAKAQAAAPAEQTIDETGTGFAATGP